MGGLTPYYHDDHVTIYHGDCLEMLDGIEADVLITDPPYGRAWKRGDTNSRRGKSSDRHDGIANDLDTSARDAVLRWWADRPAAVFGDLTLPPPAGVKLTLVYDKGHHAGFTGAVAGYRRNAEAIYLLGRLTSGLGGRSSVISTNTGHIGFLSKATGHPHTKPLDVMRLLIESMPDGVILDPFMGSGSTLRAAKDLGRRAIGIELDERYCEIAAKRCAQEVLDLFAS